MTEVKNPEELKAQQDKSQDILVGHIGPETLSAERQAQLDREVAKVTGVYRSFDVNAQAEKLPEAMQIAIKEEAAMKDAYSSYALSNGKIIDKRNNKVVIKDKNKITESEKNALLSQFGGRIDSGGNIVMGSGDSQFVLNTNAASAKKAENKDSTYSMSNQDFSKVTQEINAANTNTSKYDISNIRANFKLTDGASYEGNIGVGVKKVQEKANLAFKIQVKKLIEIAEVNHGIFLEFERTMGGEFQKILGGTVISLDDQGKTLLKLSAQDLRKVVDVNLDQFGKSSFKGHQVSYGAELVHKMDTILREMSFSVIHSQSSNHSFGLLGSQLVNDPAFKQYFEYYGYFQGATRDEAKAKFDFELDRRVKLSVGGGVERIKYNKLGKNVLGDDIKTENNTKISPTVDLSVTVQSGDDKMRVTPGIKASGTMKEVGVAGEYMMGSGVSLEAKLGYVQHTGTNRPGETTGYVGVNRTIGSDRDVFSSLFEGSLKEKSEDLLEKLSALRGRQLVKSHIVLLTDTMKGRSTADLLSTPEFMKVITIIGTKLGVPSLTSRLGTPDGLALTILMIDYLARKQFNVGIFSADYKDHLQMSAQELDRINQARKGVTLADLETRMHGENIYGRGYVDKVSIWKYNKGTGISETIDNGIDLPGSGILVVGGNAVSSNPAGVTGLFTVTGVSTIHISLANIKELHRKVGARNVNLNFAETGGTFYNINVDITPGSIHFGNNRKISGMPLDLSNAMVNDQINSVILTSLLTGTQLSIATAADMHFHRGDFTTALVDRFISGQYSYIVMNGIKAGSYSAANIAALQAGTLTNAQAEAALSDSVPPTTPVFTITEGAYTKSATINLSVTANADVAGWFISESATAPTAGAAGWTASAPTTYNLSATDGLKNVYIYSKDAAGNVQPTGGTRSITLDTVAPSGQPTFQGTTPDTKGYGYTGLVLRTTESLVGGSITSITSSTGGTVSGITINGSGDIVFNWTTPNAGGSVLTVVGTDKAGNAFTLTTAAITLPNDPAGPSGTPPVLGAIPAQTPAQGTAYSLALAGFVTLTEGNPILSYAMTAGALPTGVSLNTTTGVISGTPSATGSFSATVSATDADGTSNTRVISFTVSPDVTPPSTPSFTITEGAYTKTTAINISTTANTDVAGWFISESSSAPAVGDAGWTSSAPTSYTLSTGDGVHNVYVFAKDAAGNVQPTGGTRSITLDTVAPSGQPTFQGTTPDTKGYGYTGLVLRTTESLVGGSITSITSSTGGTVSGITINGSGDIVFNWTTPNAGGSVLTVVGTDKAGNAFTLTTAAITLPNAPNNAPVFGVGSVADTLTIGALIGYVLPNATDADAGDTLTYSISNPTVIGAGVTFDPATRTLDGLIDGPARTETLTYTVNDGHGGTQSINVIFTIS